MRRSKQGFEPIMNAIEEMAQAFEHSPEVRERLERSYFRARVLDGKRRDVMVGRAIFEFETPGKGMFLPDNAIPDGVRLHEAAFLISSNGREFALRDFELCLPNDPHFHFFYEVVGRVED